MWCVGGECECGVCGESVSVVCGGECECGVCGE